MDSFKRKKNFGVRCTLKRLTNPTTYFIHCDLVDKGKSLFNGRKSDLLARFHITGKPFEKVSYNASLQQVLRECSTGDYVNSITLSVRDENGTRFLTSENARRI